MGIGRQRYFRVKDAEHKANGAYFITIHSSGRHTRRWWMRLVAKNGRIIMASETYHREFFCRRSAKRLSKATGIPINEQKSGYRKGEF